eukprot:3185841-Prymnesium_polylepis.1
MPFRALRRRPGSSCRDDGALHQARYRDGLRAEGLRALEDHASNSAHNFMLACLDPKLTLPVQV